MMQGTRPNMLLATSAGKSLSFELSVVLFCLREPENNHKSSFLHSLDMIPASTLGFT